jgi:hypothetical protein
LGLRQVEAVVLLLKGLLLLAFSNFVDFLFFNIDIINLIAGFFHQLRTLENVYL